MKLCVPWPGRAGGCAGGQQLAEGSLLDQLLAAE